MQFLEASCFSQAGSGGISGGWAYTLTTLFRDVPERNILSLLALPLLLQVVLNK